jgi:hypothetical protein
MTIRTSFLVLATSTLVIGCGPTARGGDDTGGDDTADDCMPSDDTETACNDGFDDDCNGFFDCDDLACSGVDGCPVNDGNCEVATPTASLALPDGVCTGIPPFGGTDAEIQTFLTTCNDYEATLSLSGFGAGARLTDPSALLGVCVKMEHSWLRDLQIEAYCPDGNRVILSKFQGQDCPNLNSPCEVFVGVPNELDGGSPGTGWDYCWTSSATNEPMIQFSNQNSAPDTLPAGDYRPSEPFSNFTNCNLNGDWRIRVVDGWGLDDGYIFESRLMFAGSLSDECPVVE